MKQEELTEVYYINKEIEIIEKELKELRNKNFYKTNVMSNMPRGGIRKDPFAEYTEKAIELETMLEYSLKKLQEKRREAENYLNGMEDGEIRVITRLRCINNLSWEEIGEAVAMDRRTVSRKYYSQFQ